MTSPRIGVLCNHGEDNSGGAFCERQLVNQPYLDRLEEAGAGCLLVHDTSDEGIVGLLELCDGLLVTGGPDVDPRVYGCQPEAKFGAVSPRRDNLDRVAVGYALEREEFPMLGICRGAQAMNALAGGTLVQDIERQVKGALKHGQSAPGWYGTHDITIAEGSRLREIVGTDRLSVNSYHHQAIDRCADGFTIVARAGDGVVEAIERDEGAFCVGLQFHPEIMAQRDENLVRVFAAFVDACR